MTRTLALLLTVSTGFSGLVYEVAWQKYLATLLGSHSEATAAVLAIFLGGLSLGYALFGRASDRRSTAAAPAGRLRGLLLFYGGVEAAIGIWALLFPRLFEAARAVSVSIPASSEPIAFACDVLLSALLVGPPAVLMGATIPVLTQALARSLRDATRFHAYVYGFNTAGAFAGALAAGFWLVPELGLVGVLRAMAAVNLVAGTVFVVLGLRARAGHLPRAAGPESAPSEGGVTGFALYAAVAVLNGFGAMAIQTVLIRMGGIAFGSSEFTFAMIVAVFVLCIALGSLAVSVLPRIPPALVVANQWALAALLVLLYRPLQDAGYWAHVLRSRFEDTDAAFYGYYGSALGGLLLAIGPPVLLSGAALPLLFHHLRREVDDLGGVAGRLYSWNTFGSLLGALLGGYLLLFWLDLHAVYRVAIAALLAAAGLLSARVLPARRRAPAAAALVVSLALVAALAPWSRERLSAGPYRVRDALPVTDRGAAAFFEALGTPRILFYDDGPAASIAVRDFTRPGQEPSRSIVSNGKSDGNIPVDYTTMALAGLLPALFVDRVERAFVIGYGTGVTVGELAALSGTREVVVAEISSAVLEASRYFEWGNLGAAANPKTRIVRRDAYRALLRSEGRFDVIASEPSNPWVTGVEMLYSAEFLEAARDRLTPGGVYAQWMHTYDMDEATLELVIRTYTRVFDAISVWYAQGPDLILLGFRDEKRGTDLAHVERRAARPDIRAGLGRAGIGGMASLVAHELLPLGVAHALALEGPVHTLLHPVLSYRAARAFFGGHRQVRLNTAHLRAARAASKTSLARMLAERSGGRLAPSEWALFSGETCRHRPRECAVVLARWAVDEPGSAAREDLLRRSRRRPGFREPLSPAIQARLSALFTDGSEGSGSLGSPAAATDLFVGYYHHSVPFDRRALAAMWRACGDGEESGDCARARARAEYRVGSLAE